MGGIWCGAGRRRPDPDLAEPAPVKSTPDEADNDHENKAIRSHRQGGCRHRRQWRHRAWHGQRDWPKPAPRSRSSDAMKGNRPPRSPSSNDSGAMGHLRGRRCHRQVRGHGHGGARNRRTRPHRHPRSTTPASTSANHRTRSISPSGNSVIATNLTSAFLCSQAVYPVMKTSGRRQDHQYRFDDVDLRRQLHARLCRQQRRGSCSSRVPVRVPGRPTTSRPMPSLPGLDRHRSHPTRACRDRRASRPGCWRARQRHAGVRFSDFAGIAVFLSSSRIGFRSPVLPFPSMADFSIMG